MSATIDGALASIREDRRSDYLWNTRTAAEAVGVHPNKFHAWWYRTRGKLEALAEADPGNTAAELLAVIVAAESNRQSRPVRDPPAPAHVRRNA